MGPVHLAPSSRARTWSQRMIIITGSLVVLVLLAAATAVGYTYARFASITRYKLELEAAASGGPANYLIVGSDSRENLSEEDPTAGAFVDDTSPTDGKRSDTIMILRIDPKAEKAAILSLPRDLYVPIAGRKGKDRINSAYGEGRQVLIDTIEENFGIIINHYVEVDFNGFKGLVQAIDGVRMYFETPVRDTQTGLRVDTPGCILLDENGALAFARSRHLEYKTENGWQTDPTADLGRITRQQIFIRRAMTKALGRGLTNPVTLNGLVGVAVDNVGLDPRLDATDIIRLGKRFAAFNPDTLVSYTIPTDSDRTSGGASIQRLLEREAEPILNVFRGLPPGSINPKLVDVTVLNGSGVDRQAEDVGAALATLGFVISETGSYREIVERTTVFHGPGGEDAGVRVLQHITGNPALVMDPDLTSSEVYVVTGVDFTTVHTEPAAAATTTTTTVPGATTATTVAPTSTTVIGKAIGEPPPGETCAA
jgi:LCP family protein required for cell wall assembly